MTTAGIHDPELPPPIFFLEDFVAPFVPLDLILAKLPKKASVNWRTGEYTSPSRHQGSCQSCTSHSTAAMLEAWWRKAGHEVTISGPYMHVCGADTDCDNGIDPAPFLTKIVGKRVPPDDGTRVWNQGCDVTEGVVVPDLQYVGSDDLAKILLAHSSPVVAGMEITGDFFDKQGPYHYEPAGEFIGDHVVCLIGYDGHGWIAQNSYGQGWRDQGFFHVPFGACYLLRGKSAFAVKYRPGT